MDTLRASSLERRKVQPAPEAKGGCVRRGALLLAALTGGLLLGCGQARRGGPVVVTQPLVPDSLNPNARLDEYSISVLSNVFESLVNTRRDLGVSGGLADSWHNPDRETWIFRLRAGVLLHDGRTLDSGLVARSLREAVASSAPGFGVDLGAIRAIERKAAGIAAVISKLASPLGNL